MKRKLMAGYEGGWSGNETSYCSWPYFRWYYNQIETFQEKYIRIVVSISLDSRTSTHHVAAYQFMVEESNTKAVKH